MNQDPMLDRVRESCQEVADRAELVSIDRERIVSYAAALSEGDLELPPMEKEYHFLGHGEATAAYVLTLETINYGSGYFPVLRKKASTSGYHTIARKLRERFEKRGPLSVDELMLVDADDCAKIFGQDRHHPVIRELMKQFALSLNELGRYLFERYDGSYMALIEEAEGSADKLVEILVTMSRFDDVAFYHDVDVSFYKRAQLTAAALHLAFGGEGPGRLEGLDRLTVFADNRLPHVLRVDGILRYAPALAGHIDAGRLLAAQSAEEVEVRACAVHAAELLVAELRRTGKEATALAVDQFLWRRGGTSEYRSLPSHRVQTIFY